MERLHVAAGHSIWATPRIRDFNGWQRDHQALRQLDDGSLPRCLSDLEERELWRAVIQADPGAADYLETAGAARGARRARRAMVEHGIPWPALGAYPTEESRALFDWNGGFEARCGELGRIPADRLLTAPPPPGERLAWTDSPLWRPVAREWLARAGALRLRPAAAAPAGAPRHLRTVSADAEPAAIAEWARVRLRSDPEFRAWVCVPDLALRRFEVIDAFDAALAAQRFSLLSGEGSAPYAVAGGTPLAQFAPVRAALAALTAGQGALRFETLSALLRSPEWHASALEEVDAARLDLVLRSRGPSEASLRHWLDLCLRLGRDEGVAAAAIRRLDRVSQILESVRGSQPMSRWVTLWVQAFEAGPWAQRERWSSAEFQAAERFRELLAELATGDAVFGSRSAGAALRLLTRASHDTPFQAQTGIPPIWVSGQVMDPWLLYDGVWIAGCGEDRWPPPVDPVPLIPVPLQRKHGVVAAGPDSQLALALDLQERWQRRAPQAVYSCADPGDGRSTNLSPLLPPGPALDQPPAPAQPHWLALAALASPLVGLDDGRAPRLGPDEGTRGVSTLRAQSLCPFRGFATTRLDAASLERPNPGFSPSERGIMVHAALDHVWSELRTSARLAALEPGARAELLQRSVARAISQQCRRRDPGDTWRRREGPRLESLLDKWLQVELLREPFEVERLEQETQVARHAGIEFKIRIDRMDRLPVDGGRVLIDYKTGAVKADWRGDRPENPQLPMYALLHPDGLVAVAYGRVDAGECGFVAEAGRDGIFKPRVRRSSLEGEPDFAALVHRWAERIDRLAAEFREGVAAVTPTPHACSSCHLQALCRVPSALAAPGEAE